MCTLHLKVTIDISCLSLVYLVVVVVGWWQSIVLCQCWWASIQGIPALFGGGGPSAKAYLSAKFCLLVVNAHVLLFLGGGGVHLPKYTCQPSFI